MKPFIAVLLVTAACSSNPPSTDKPDVSGTSTVEECQTATDCAQNDDVCWRGECLGLWPCANGADCPAESVCVFDAVSYCDGCEQGQCMVPHACPDGATCIPGEQLNTADAGTD